MTKVTTSSPTPRDRRSAAERDPRPRVRPQQVGVDAVVDDSEPVPEDRRDAARLPGGRADQPVGGLEGEELRGVAGAGAEGIALRAGKFRVEARIGARRAVEELREGQEPGPRPDVLEKKRLAPARMAADHVRAKPLGLEGERRPRRRLAPQGRGLEARRRRMDAGRRAAGYRVAEVAHPRQGRRRIDAERHHSAPGRAASAGAMCRYWPGKFWWTKRTRIGSRSAPSRQRTGPGCSTVPVAAESRGRRHLRPGRACRHLAGETDDEGETGC